MSHLKRPWCWERLKVGGEGDDRGWDGWMASLTQWTWVWVNSRSWWWTGRPCMLQSMGLQRVRHDWVTELTDLYRVCLFLLNTVTHTWAQSPAVSITFSLPESRDRPWVSHISKRVITIMLLGKFKFFFFFFLLLKHLKLGSCVFLKIYEHSWYTSVIGQSACFVSKALLGDGEEEGVASPLGTSCFSTCTKALPAGRISGPQTLLSTNNIIPCCAFLNASSCKTDCFLR